MEGSTARVPVVDDYEPFRRFVRSTLERRPELQVIAEAADGLEAVQKAEELHSDLILLDVGLPTLNGIEAARRIRKLSPESRILFVSQESFADVVQEALRTGAMGYIVKMHARSDLLAPADARVGMTYQFVQEALEIGLHLNDGLFFEQIGAVFEIADSIADDLPSDFSQAA